MAASLLSGGRDMLASTQLWVLLFGVAAVVLLGIIIAIRAKKRKGG